MKRYGLLLGLLILAAVAYFNIEDRSDDLAILNARAIQVQGRDNMFVVTLEIQNEGAPKRLTGITSSQARAAHVMNFTHGDAPILIPAESSGFFAMDGAHIMFMGAGDDLEEGSFLPLTLSFDGDLTINARALIGSDMSAMDHSLEAGIQTENSPTISIIAKEPITAEGADVSIELENFNLVRRENGAAHTPGEGHAHIYLNGLKLGRLYESSFTLGALPSGAYDLTVSLNANDHRPYVNHGAIVQDTLSFVID